MRNETFFPHKVLIKVIPVLFICSVLLLLVFINTVYLPADRQTKLIYTPLVIILSFPFLAMLLGFIESSKRIRIQGDQLLVRTLFRTSEIQKDYIEKVLINHEMGSAIKQYRPIDKPMPIVKGLMFRFVLKNGEEFPFRIRNESGNGWALIGDPNSVYEKALEFFKRHGIEVEKLDPIK